MILYLDPQKTLPKNCQAHKQAYNTNNEQTEKEYMETILFTIASKNQIPRSKLNKGYE
jgi:hypothetical protein